jgi:hypothetical protein
MLSVHVEGYARKKNILRTKFLGWDIIKSLIMIIVL